MLLLPELFAAVRPRSIGTHSLVGQMVTRVGLGVRKPALLMHQPYNAPMLSQLSVNGHVIARKAAPASWSKKKA